MSEFGINGFGIPPKTFKSIYSSANKLMDILTKFCVQVDYDKYRIFVLTCEDMMQDIDVIERILEPDLSVETLMRIFYNLLMSLRESNNSLEGFLPIAHRPGLIQSYNDTFNRFYSLLNKTLYENLAVRFPNVVFKLPALESVHDL